MEEWIHWCQSAWMRGVGEEGHKPSFNRGNFTTIAWMYSFKNRRAMPRDIKNHLRRTLNPRIALGTVRGSASVDKWQLPWAVNKRQCVLSMLPGEYPSLTYLARERSWHIWCCCQIDLSANQLPCKPLFSRSFLQAGWYRYTWCGGLLSGYIYLHGYHWNPSIYNGKGVGLFVS